MKDLTIEEKAERYDVVIEKLRSLHDNYDTVSTLIDVKEELEHIFPELKESEDERMKRVLTEGFAILSKDEEWYDGVTVGQILAWFEKRGEQNPTDKVEQKHAEWSEEDERERKRVVGLLEGWLSTFKETNYAEDCKCGIDWLKSLKDRVQPKVELTQLDKNILEAAIAFVEQNNHFNCWRGVDKHTVLSALHSLRPQNTWKPSEQDILLLERIANNKSNPQDFQASLCGLIGELKKLREE